MNVEDFRLFCLAKKGVTEEFPFDENTLVFKVMGKMFALTGLNNPNFSVNLKCHPEKAEALRESYGSVLPGYHMNKKHWNTIEVWQGELNTKQLEDLVNHSYELVCNSLPKKLKAQL